MLGFSQQNNKLCTSISLNIFFLVAYTFAHNINCSSIQNIYIFLSNNFYNFISMASSNTFNIPQKIWKLLLIAFNFTLLFIWIYFSNHSNLLMPYKNLLIPS